MGNLFVPMAASGIVAPITLIEILTAAGKTYFVSEQMTTAPSLITGAPAQYLDWLIGAPEFHETGTVETDTGSIEIQNISGTTVQRDAGLMFTETELIGALVICRIWRGDAQTALRTYFMQVTAAQINHASLRLSLETSLGNWSAIIAPAYKIDVACPLTFASKACGSVSPTPCDQTYGNCSSVNRFMGVITAWVTDTPNVQLAQPAPVNTFNPGRQF